MSLQLITHKFEVYKHTYICEASAPNGHQRESIKTQIKIDFERLPKTFQDAIVTVRQLGINYI